MENVAGHPDPKASDLRARLQRTEGLVAAAQRAEAGALDALVRGHLEDLRAFVRLKLEPGLRLRESCSDLVQSVCREVVEGLRRFEDRGPGSFRAWLFTAALNKIRQRYHYWEAEKRSNKREVDPEPGPGPDGTGHPYASLCSLGGSPSEHAIAREQAVRIERAMDQLSPEQREVLLLARIVGLGHKEIAERMGRSEVAIRSLLSRGSLRLLAAIEERI